MNSTISSLLTVLAGAGTTAVVGNYLVQRWQRANWYEQQRQLIHQQELTELKSLLDRLTSQADARLHAMRTLANAVSAGPGEELDTALKGYREQLAIWNSTLRSHYPMLTLHYGYATTLRLEDQVHRGFVACGRLLEQAVRLVLAGAAPPPATFMQLSLSLNAQAGVLSDFYEMLASGLERRRSDILNGKVYRYSSGRLEVFTTADLIKALFVADVDGLNVVRPA